MQAALAVLLATFSGFGATMFATSILMEILNLRRRWVAGLNPSQPSATANQTAVDSVHGVHDSGEQHMAVDPREY